MNKDQLPIPGLNPASKEADRDDCYFYSNDRCLGRPADTCKWAVKIGDWEWLCAYPWNVKEDYGHR